MPIAASLLPALEKEAIGSYKNLAREQFGREVGIWTLGTIVQGDTKQKAEEFLNYFAVQYEDTPAVDAWVAGMAKESRTLDDRATQFARIVVTSGGNPIIGTATDIADQLETLSEFGVDASYCLGLISRMA